MAAAAFFTFCGYESIRSPATTIYMSVYGPENLGLIISAIPLCLLALLYGYGLLLSRCGPRRTLLITSLLSSAGIISLYYLLRSGLSAAPAALYIFQQAYIVILVEQYWSFPDSRLSSKTAKRLNGIITGFGSLGGVTGGLAVHRLAASLGTINLLPLSAAAILPAAVFSRNGVPQMRRAGKG